MKKETRCLRLLKKTSADIIKKEKEKENEAINQNVEELNKENITEDELLEVDEEKDVLELDSEEEGEGKTNAKDNIPEVASKPNKEDGVDEVEQSSTYQWMFRWFQMLAEGGY